MVRQKDSTNQSFHGCARLAFRRLANGMAIIANTTWLSLSGRERHGGDNEGTVRCGGIACARRTRKRTGSGLPGANGDDYRSLRARRPGRRDRPDSSRTSSPVILGSSSWSRTSAARAERSDRCAQRVPQPTAIRSFPATWARTPRRRFSIPTWAMTPRRTSSRSA